MTLRVLHIHGNPYFGGSETGLIQQVRLQRPLGVEHIVVTRSHGLFWERLNAEGVKRCWHPLTAPRAASWRSVGYWHGLAALVREKNADIVHVCGLQMLGQVYALALLQDAPLLLTVHGTAAGVAGDRFVMRCLKAVSKVVCVSRFVAETVASLGCDGRVEVVHNGIDLAVCVPKESRTVVRSRMGISEGDFVVCMVANFDQACKRHDTLVRAAASLPAHERIQCVIVGGVGPGRAYFASIQGLVHSLGVESRLHMAGFQKDPLSYIAASDVLVLCTKGEGFGRVLLEAMALERPVIVTRSGACAEVVEENRTGLFFELGDHETLARHIVRLSRDRELGRQMGRAGFTRVREAFTEQTNAEAMCRIYTSLTEEVQECRRRLLRGLLREAVGRWVIAR